jgi:chorismate synthase
MNDPATTPAAPAAPAGSAAPKASGPAVAAPAAIDVAGLVVRQLAGPDDYRACLELQLATWGRQFEGAVPPSVLKISQRVGGVLAGAFAADGRLLGFVYGLTGVRPPGSPGAAAPGSSPELFHWSHMLAVAPEARDLGLGTRLKLFQRELLVPLGVGTVEWTYDPLEARNAHLNLNRLGGEVVEYVEDMYKGEEGSELSSGIGTDRFIVAWRIAGDPAPAAGAGLGQRSAPPGGRLAEAAGQEAAARFANAPWFEPAPAPPAAPAVGASPDGAEPPLPEAPRVRIEIPARIQELKEREPERALAWRLGTRRAFEAYLGRGYRVTAFGRDAAGRCFYGVEAMGR